MRRSVRTAVIGATALLAMLGVTAGVPSAPVTRASQVRVMPTCAVAAKGFASCNAKVVVGATRTPLAIRSGTVGATPRGLGAGDIRAAYALSAPFGRGHTVAIVDAYNDPNVACRPAPWPTTAFAR
jgi:hypothetical protein